MRRCLIFTREKKRLLFPFTTHPVKKAFEALRRALQTRIIKIIIPLNMAKAHAAAIENRHTQSKAAARYFVLRPCRLYYAVTDAAYPAGRRRGSAAQRR